MARPPETGSLWHARRVWIIGSSSPLMLLAEQISVYPKLAACIRSTNRRRAVDPESLQYAPGKNDESSCGWSGCQFSVQA